MNERQDYFGQTVNIASRVQGLANSQAIFATGSVIDDRKTADLLQRQSLMPTSHDVGLRGIEREVRVYAIPEGGMRLT
jgi:class 3 adenylate cyclase